MRKLVRCKVCGYIMYEDKLKEKCPACGALRQVFEPYTDPLSQARRNVLDMDLHRIAVHFPIAFAVMIPFLLVGAFVFSAHAAIMLMTVRLMVLLLPLFIILAYFVGMLDGVTRFRKIKVSEILKKKVIYGIIFFALSIVLNILVWTAGFRHGPIMALEIVIAVLAVACATELGLLGRGIMNSAFPGK
jgi:uncharacterized protein (DUF983 family)